MTAAATLSSCRKQASPETVQPDFSCPIEYSVFTVSTKGLDPITNTNLKAKGFGVIGFWSAKDKDFPATEYCDNIYIDNAKGTADENGIWTCKPAAYWPVEHKVSFFAYAPHSANLQPVGANTPELVFPAMDYSNGTSGSLPKGIYVPSKDITSQTDLCLARPMLNLSKQDNSVELNFFHALTNVRFYANIEGTKTPGLEYKAEELIIDSIIDSTSFTFKIPDENGFPFAWDDIVDEAQYGSYLLKDSGNAPQISSKSWIKYKNEGESGSDAYTLINDLNNGRLYLIPQTLTDRANIKLQIALYKVTENISTKIGSLQPITIKLPTSIPWTPSKTISYLMTIKLGGEEGDNVYIETSISGVMEDWHSSANNHDTEIIE